MLDQGAHSGPRHFPSKFPYKVALVESWHAFRLRRLAQSLRRGFGLQHFTSKFPHKVALVKPWHAFRLRRLAHSVLPSLPPQHPPGVGWDVMLRWSWGGVGWGGMLMFMFMLRWWCYIDHGVGWGGMLTFMFMLRRCCCVDHGVGWGGMLTFMFMLRWRCYVDHGVGRCGMFTLMFMLRWNCSMVEVVFVGKQACKAACAVTLGSARKPLKTTRRLSALISWTYLPETLAHLNFLIAREPLLHCDFPVDHFHDVCLAIFQHRCRCQWATLATTSWMPSRTGRFFSPIPMDGSWFLHQDILVRSRGTTYLIGLDLREK